MSLDEIISKTKGPRQQKGGRGNANGKPRPFFKSGRTVGGGGRIQKRRGGGAGVAGGRPRFPRVSVQYRL